MCTPNLAWSPRRGERSGSGADQRCGADCRRNAVQDVKKVVEQIKADGRHSIGCIAKCIVRGANMTLSTRRPLPGETHHRETGRGLVGTVHHHRAEHWVVVAGTAKVTIMVISNCLVKTSPFIFRWGRRLPGKSGENSARFN